MVLPLQRRGYQQLVVIDKNEDGSVEVENVLKVRYSSLQDAKHQRTSPENNNTGVQDSPNKNWGTFKTTYRDQAFSQKELDSMVFKGVKISVIHGDITMEDTEAIVNSANGILQHNGGIAKRIVDKGGPSIVEESEEIIKQRGGVPIFTGESMHTKSGDLESKYLIHTVGPVWWGGNHNEEWLLR